MKKIKLCVWCGNYPAIIPIKRNNIGRVKKEICQNCHSERLRDDLDLIIHIEEKRKQE